MRKTVSGLYAVTPGLADPALLASKIEAALRGGARVVQYRNKTAHERLRHEQALQIARLCRDAGACFIINDSIELAREVGADGVHLGEDDDGVGAARALLGPGKLIGVSCYDQLSRARDAVAQGADYIAFGSFFPSPTKPGVVTASRDLLRAAKRFSRPIVAIGGITPDNAAALIEAGADAVAVVSAVFDAPDIERAARRIADLFAEHSES
ncbi:MAG TPA: thiamine phosphate synthase [Burkholderiales bacterium]|jgi:thiamine-phosphate pyrophosphorylase|nr:thiamine phosphate synthase [Burkholderiales bacterium]